MSRINLRRGFLIDPRSLFLPSCGKFLCYPFVPVLSIRSALSFPVVFIRNVRNQVLLLDTSTNTGTSTWDGRRKESLSIFSVSSFLYKDESASRACNMQHAISDSMSSASCGPFLLQKLQQARWAQARRQGSSTLLYGSTAPILVPGALSTSLHRPHL